MAKDGTTRGGKRQGAGRPRKSLAEKILEGKAAVENQKESKKNQTDGEKNQTRPKKYLTAEQTTGGGKTYARQIYRETQDWIASHRCEAYVPKQLVESFSHVTARHIQCEEMLSEFGLLTKSPTTGEAVASPLIKTSLEYLKQSHVLWSQIAAAVRENGTVPIESTPDPMAELLLRRIK